jgi:phenylalanyl-tRNA synthetase beta chain
MKIQYSYLKSFLKTKLSQAKLADIFTQVGFECEIEGSLIEFDITPNRGDVLSLRGLEREFLAYQSKKSLQSIEVFPLILQKNKSIINKIDDTGCGNYNLMLIKGLQKINQLDSKKRNFLVNAGVPLIHPLVDLGNYVMFEIGAPMHIFDLEKLSLPINVIFPKSKKNSLRVIGGDVKDIQPSSLTIQDQSGIQAIAGIIGGEESSVSKATKNIAVEAAFFKANKIVNQARKYGLATDASHRFERGVDPKIQALALERYLFLLNEIAEYNSSELYSSGSKGLKKNIIKFNLDRFNKFSGINLKVNQVIKILKNLGFNLSFKNTTNIAFEVPSHRFDISLEEDLYEELLRCYGYDNIPISTPKPGPILTRKFKPVLADLRAAFIYSGFKELMHMPFVSHDSFESLNSNSWTPAQLKNPINEHEPLLRGSLFTSLFTAVNANLKRGHLTIKAFEVGNVFFKSNSSFKQELHLSGIIYYHEAQTYWSDKEFKYDFYSLKAEILKLLQTSGVQDIQFRKNSVCIPFNKNSLEILDGKVKIGVFGEIDLSLTEKLIKKPALGFEMYPDKISFNSKQNLIHLTSKFPLSTKDMNIIISKSNTYSEIENILTAGKINHLSTFNLVNTYEGKDIETDSVSMTLRFVFQSKTKSLLESEINNSMKQAFQLLKRGLKAKIRS